MDETYIKVKGEWVYLYRAVDKFGEPLISCFPNVEMKGRLPPFSNKPSTPTGFLTKSSWISVANYAGLENINMLLMLAGLISFVEILQVKYS